MHFLHFVHFGHFRKFLKCTKCTKCHRVFWRKFRNERSDRKEWLTTNKESEMWQCSSGFCSVWTRHEPVISKGLIVTNIINYLKLGNYIRVILNLFKTTIIVNLDVNYSYLAIQLERSASFASLIRLYVNSRIVLFLL